MIKQNEAKIDYFVDISQSHQFTITILWLNSIIRVELSCQHRRSDGIVDQFCRSILTHNFSRVLLIFYFIIFWIHKYDFNLTFKYRTSCSPKYQWLIIGLIFHRLISKTLPPLCRTLEKAIFCLKKSTAGWEKLARAENLCGWSSFSLYFAKFIECTKRCSYHQKLKKNLMEIGDLEG